MNKSILSKRLVVVLSVLLIFALTMTGCSGKSATKAAEGNIIVTISIMCDSLKDVDAELMDKVSDNGTILKETELELKEGATALDALKESGKDCAETGGMVTEINGLAGGAAGEMSGWLFKHEGDFPPVGAGDLELKNGDRVEFVFTTNGGEDLGLTF